MEQRFEIRKRELIEDCRVGPETFEGAEARLEAFAGTFLDAFESQADRRDGRAYLAGLLSDLPRKNAEAIAYRHGSDRQKIQEFIAVAAWKREPLARELVAQVARTLGRPDAVIVFDPSAFAKKGTASVGVQRQWCGRLGKVENCQVGVYMAYVTADEHVLVDTRLFLPRDWAASRARRKACGVPAGVEFRTRHQLALEMLDAHRGALPHGWVSGDDEMGRPAWFRRELQARGERYLLAVPSNTCVRDLDAAPTAAAPGARGRPRKMPFRSVRSWCESLPAGAWSEVTVREGEKGPLTVEVACGRVESKSEGKCAEHAEMLVVTRCMEGKAWKHDYYLSNADASTPAAEFARVAKAEHRVEDCLKRCKGETGLADCQARGWEAWHNHQLLSMLAQWFLIGESRRGKKDDAGADASAGAAGPGLPAAPGLSLRHRGAQPPRAGAPAHPQRAGEVLPPQVT